MLSIIGHQTLAGSIYLQHLLSMRKNVDGMNGFHEIEPDYFVMFKLILIIM